MCTPWRDDVVKRASSDRVAMVTRTEMFRNLFRSLFCLNVDNIYWIYLFMHFKKCFKIWASHLLTFFWRHYAVTSLYVHTACCYGNKIQYRRRNPSAYCVFVKLFWSGRKHEGKRGDSDRVWWGLQQNEGGLSKKFELSIVVHNEKYYMATAFKMVSKNCCNIFRERPLRQISGGISFPYGDNLRPEGQKWPLWASSGPKGLLKVCEHLKFTNEVTQSKV